MQQGFESGVSPSFDGKERIEPTRDRRIDTLGEFAGALIHELSQPLCAIVANASAARRMLERDSAERSTIVEALDAIAADGERAGELMRRLRVLLGSGPGEREPLDLNEIVRGVVDRVGERIEQMHVTLELDLADGLPPVLGDAVQFQQVLLNLVVNGIEAMIDHDEASRTLSISTASEGSGDVEVAVRDRGSGIDPQIGGCIFDPFFTTKPSGMGMGLTISRTIVEAHGGLLRAGPRSGGGTVFRLSLQAIDQVPT